MLACARGLAGAANVGATRTPRQPTSGTIVFPTGAWLGIDRFVTDDGQNTLLLSDYSSGVVRRLFPISASEFVMGPAFNTASPAESLTVRFMTDEPGAATGISLRQANGTETLAERVTLNVQEVTFDQADAKLAGTLLTPTTPGPHPAIILLHGSGPLTRYKFGPYPHFFTSLGFAVLIYDKRGTGASTGLRMDASTGTVMKPSFYPDDLANDALAALRFLQQRKDIDPRRIGFSGLERSGMLATYVASRSQDVAFAINFFGLHGTAMDDVAVAGRRHSGRNGRFRRAHREATGVCRVVDARCADRQGMGGIQGAGTADRGVGRLMDISVARPLHVSRPVALGLGSRADVRSIACSRESDVPRARRVRRVGHGNSGA